MSEREIVDPLSAQLQAGQFYGQVLRKQACSELLLSELRHQNERRLPEHSHRLANFCLLLAGNYSEFLGRRTLSYKPLTVVFHPPGLEHRDEIGMGGGHFFSVELESTWLQRFSEYATVPETITPAQTSDLTWLTMRLYREFRQPDACSPLAVEGLVMAMLTETTRNRARFEKQIPIWLKRVLDLIQDQFRQNLTIIGLAAEVGVHPFHLSKVFRQFQGQSIGEFVNSLRIKFACRQLGASTSRLADIALDSGFADQSHFTRVFKQLTGTTPGAFRSDIRRK